MKNHKWALTIGVIGLALVLAANTGCHRKKGTGIDTSQTGAAANTGAGGANTGEQPAVDPTTLTWTQLSEGKIYFDYDSSELRADARDLLKANADLIKGLPAGTVVQLAGHCDERGTQEYNMALGERRALAARDYLISLGIPANQIMTVSYGEEMPANPGHDESAWAQNRRVEFLKGQ